jgi:hypothetical protein
MNKRLLIIAVLLSLLMVSAVVVSAQDTVAGHGRGVTGDSYANVRLGDMSKSDIVDLLVEVPAETIQLEM